MMHPFLAHLIGDFLIQNDWMASNKKNNSFVAFVHVLTYLIPFVFTGLQWWQIALIGVTHFAQDSSSFVDWFIRVWKKIPEGERGVMPLAVDQVFHLVIIQLVMWIAI